MLLHHLQKLDNDLGARADEHLALAGLLGVVDGVKRIVKNGSANHVDDLVVLLLLVIVRFSTQRIAWLVRVEVSGIISWLLVKGAKSALEGGF